MIERQELHCHNCGQYVQFDIDLSEDGNMTLPCPVCGHEHCRVVKDGKITAERWDQRNGTAVFVGGSTNSFYISASNISTTAQSTFSNYNSAYSSNTITTQGNSMSAFLYQSWMNTTPVVSTT